MLAAECKLQTTAKAELLIKLLEDNSDYQMHYYIDAVNCYNTFEDAQMFLNQPCPRCTINHPMDDVGCCDFVLMLCNSYCIGGENCFYVG